MSNTTPIADLVGLSGRIAVVTGAASGIGRVTAGVLAAAGAGVALLGVDAEGGEAAASAIRDTGGTASFFPCDVTREQDCRHAVESVMQAFGRIDILFNNADVIVRKDIVEYVAKPELLRAGEHKARIRGSLSVDRDCPQASRTRVLDWPAIQEDI